MITIEKKQYGNYICLEHDQNYVDDDQNDDEDDQNDNDDGDQNDDDRMMMMIQGDHN